MENEELIEDGDEPNQILYVFDDLVVELKKKENTNSLLKLIYSRRHMNAYIIILTQKFNSHLFFGMKSPISQQQQLFINRYGIQFTILYSNTQSIQAHKSIRGQLDNLI